MISAVDIKIKEYTETGNYFNVVYKTIGVPLEPLGKGKIAGWRRISVIPVKYDEKVCLGMKSARYRFRGENSDKGTDENRRLFH